MPGAISNLLTFIHGFCIAVLAQVFVVVDIQTVASALGLCAMPFSLGRKLRHALALFHAYFAPHAGLYSDVKEAYDVLVEHVDENFPGATRVPRGRRAMIGLGADRRVKHYKNQVLH